ncbi:MAG TPA: polyribonucleotide nucleotidyltransferase [Dehalococcoidia bacterium]|nr:polyribonucleotide nucleotidyltransferase [Dehalococcoidia bacterium]
MPQSGQCTVGGRVLTIETGKLATQADSAVTVRYGDTVVLVTVCFSDEPREDADFVTLTVDYEERLYAVGKIPGSFIRREGRPSEEAVLAGRLTDRSLRPLFDKSLRNDVQIVITVLSTDQENDPDILALNGASAALKLSAIPFGGPVAAVRIGCLNGSLVLNPTLPQINDSLLDLVVASTREAIVMIEAGAKEVSEDLILEAIQLGHQANQELLELQETLHQACGKPKMDLKAVEISPELRAACLSEFGERLTRAVSYTERAKREEAIEAVKKEAIERFKESFTDGEIIAAVEDQLRKAVRTRILQSKRHLDGRQSYEIRPISCEVGLLPRTHGSGLFTRGLTQVLTITTLGSLRQEQLLDGLGLAETKRFMHHYNFPPFSTGEVKRLGSPGRREIGHGALAERALIPVVPSEEEFAYTIRLVSEVLSSNGSTSMASVCSSSLALMDAGVPIKAPVAGIAMGLVTDGDDYVVLTDIEGIEDAYGDMDFKVAGTSQGITALQLDIKLKGISYRILAEAIKQARSAHFEILDKLQHTLSTSRAELSPYAPKMHKISIDPSKIGTLIGPGGKTIRSIIDETKVTIDVENDGTVIIGSPDKEAAQKAIDRVLSLTQDVEVGNVYTGKVTRLTNFGAFVEVLPGKEGLVHISELADYHVSRVENVVKVGDEIMVKVIEIDHLGRINLSRRAVFEELAQVRGVRVMDSTAAGRPKSKQPKRSPAAQQRGDRDNWRRRFNR